VRGPLHGVPMAHKDMYYRRGVVSTCGSKILRDTPASATAKVLEHLDAAGAIQFGVLNMAEFAMGPTGHNWHYGHCRNPWDPERVTGGSSSGSGASVAARANFAALGSDTGGSVRLPAAFCGTAGIRPTHGLVPVENILPLCPSLDTVGPLTRTVEDAALVLQVISQRNLMERLEKPVAGLRIGRPRQVFYEGCDAEIAAAMDASLDVFRRLGATVVDVDLPDFSRLSALAAVLHAAEANPFHDEWFRTRPQDYSPQVRERLERGRPTLAGDYLKAMQARRPAIADFCEAVFSKVDLVHGPVVSFQTPTIEETDISTGDAAAEMLGRFVRLTRPISYLGLPVACANAGFTSAGMPIGMQLIAAPFEDATALRAGHAFERAANLALDLLREPNFGGDQCA
jgi:aspartyl-tRNA(Asn)/glutamyl-tRNA(Gln) amidotransferase subunit A